MEENIVSKIIGCNSKESRKYLSLSKGNIKIAVIMKLKKVSFKDAREILLNCGDDLKTALQEKKV